MVEQWVAPQSLQALQLKLSHNGNSAAHSGVDSIQYITSSIIYQRSIAATTTTRIPQIAVPPRRLHQRITMDLVHCKTPTDRNNRYIAALLESVSAYCFLF